MSVTNGRPGLATNASQHELVLSNSLLRVRYCKRSVHVTNKRQLAHIPLKGGTSFKASPKLMNSPFIPVALLPTALWELEGFMMGLSKDSPFATDTRSSSLRQVPRFAAALLPLLAFPFSR